jgi:MoaA/NifB/PqqE/SkfB family radical SAM enzyme
MSTTICPLPWIHLATRPNGDVRLCCTSNASGAGSTDDKTAGLVKDDGVPMNLRESSIEEIWNSSFMKQTRLQMLNGEIPNSCTKCFTEEDNGIVSKRQWETEVWKNRINLDEIYKQTGQDGSLPCKIPYFDLRLGNVCNLKCTMCSPHDSSSWIKDWKLMVSSIKDSQLKNDLDWDSSFDYTWYQKNDFLASVNQQLGNIKELYFAGGEPLMIPEHKNILEKLIESGHSRNIILRYNSNGTYINDDFLRIWSHFEKVKFNFSLDAVGDRNNYIRYPSEWDSVYNKLHTITTQSSNNVFVNVACAVQALNVIHLPDMARFFIENKIDINRKNEGAPIIGTHLVYLPSYQNVRVLPLTEKKKAAENIECFLSEVNDKYFNSHPYGKQRWLGLIDYMFQEDWSNKLPMLTEYLDTLDKQRGLSWRDYFPELDF